MFCNVLVGDADFGVSEHQRQRHAPQSFIYVYSLNIAIASFTARVQNNTNIYVYEGLSTNVGACSSSWSESFIYRHLRLHIPARQMDAEPNPWMWADSEFLAGLPASRTCHLFLQPQRVARATTGTSRCCRGNSSMIRNTPTGPKWLGCPRTITS